MQIENRNNTSMDLYTLKQLETELAPLTQAPINTRPIFEEEEMKKTNHLGWVEKFHRAIQIEQNHVTSHEYDEETCVKIKKYSTHLLNR